MQNCADIPEVPAPKSMVSQRRGARADFPAWKARLEEAVWESKATIVAELMREQGGSEQSYVALAQCSARLRMAIGEGQSPTVGFYELWALPVLVRDGAIFSDKAWFLSLNEQLRTVRNEINLPPHHAWTLFSRVSPLDWVCSWDASALRTHLHRFVPGSGPFPLAFDAKRIPLPSEAPRLGLVMMAFGLREQWPSGNADLSNQCASMNKSSRRRSLALAHLGSLDCFSDAVRPLDPPMQFPHAVLAGIGRWLTVLHYQIGIADWDLELNPLHLDTVHLHLGLRDRNTPGTCLDLRLYQLGLHGVHHLAQLLQGMAPNRNTLFGLSDRSRH